MAEIPDVCLFCDLQYLLNVLNFKIQAEENIPVQKSGKRLLIHEVHGAAFDHRFLLFGGYGFTLKKYSAYAVCSSTVD